jgi:hypothetical protein
VAEININGGSSDVDGNGEDELKQETHIRILDAIEI